MSLDESDNEERTIFVGNLSEKVTQDLLTELFLQAGPVVRVAIPKEKSEPGKDGKNKTYGFVTYKHRITVPYALNIFNGTKLFGKELLLKNRSSSSNNNSNRNSFSNPATPLSSLTQTATNPLLNAINDHSMMPNISMMPAVSFEQQQQYLQQQLINQQIMQLANASAMQMFNQNNLEPNFPSTFSDQMGSHRERDLVDRNRFHRNEDRNSRKPYNRRSRSRSRSPVSSHQRNRSRSPNNRRDRDRRRDDRGYHRWNYRK